MFDFNKWESVRALIHELGRLDFKHIVMMYKVKFYRKLYRSVNYTLSDLFWMFLVSSGDGVCCGVFIDGRPNVAYERIQKHFADSCNYL